MEDLWVPTEEIESIANSREHVRLVISWEPRQVPILFQLSERFLLRWAENDKMAGVPVELESWFYDFRLQEVRVTLSRGHSNTVAGIERGNGESEIADENLPSNLTLV